MADQKPLELLGQLGSGQQVYDRHESHIAPKLRQLVVQALGKTYLNQKEQFAERLVDFGKNIGIQTCVKTGPEDEIVFAQRHNRGGMTRFVKNRQGEPCSTMLVVLKRKDDDPKGYILITAFIGGQSAVEPWDRRATPEAVEFWKNHALIWDENLIIPGTETTEPQW